MIICYESDGLLNTFFCTLLLSPFLLPIFLSFPAKSSSSRLCFRFCSFFYPLVILSQVPFSVFVFRARKRTASNFFRWVPNLASRERGREEESLQPARLPEISSDGDLTRVGRRRRHTVGLDSTKRILESILVQDSRK